MSFLFFLIRLGPGDPIERLLGPNATEQEVLSYKKQLGLDQSLLQQYKFYFGGFILGDWGKSLYKKKLVIDLLKKAIKPTITIAFVSLFFIVLIGPLLGFLLALVQHSWIDHLFRVVTLGSLSIPIFCLGPFLILLFSIQLGWFPVSEWGGIDHLVLPVMTLVIPLSSLLARVARNKFLEESQAPWIQVLRAKGLPEGKIFFRIAKVCLPSIFNVLAITLSVILGGTLVTETIFDIPGVGGLLLEAIQNRDYPITQAVVAYTTTIYMGLYYGVDYLNQLVDPRIKA